jgi:co-chaperonin GroES (HSP10)
MDTAEFLVIDVLNGKLPAFKCAHPDDLMLLEYREDEMLESGIVIMAVSTQKFNQMNILPKWKVIAVGDNVIEKLDVRPGDMVITQRGAGRLRTLGEIPVRLVSRFSILAKVQREVKDFESMIKRAYKKPSFEGVQV